MVLVSSAAAQGELVTLFEGDLEYIAGDEAVAVFDVADPESLWFSVTFDLTAPGAVGDFTITLDHPDVSPHEGFADLVYLNDQAVGVLLDSSNTWVSDQKIGGAGSLLQETGNVLEIRSIPVNGYTNDIQVNNVTLSSVAVPGPSLLGMVSLGAYRRRRGN